jgi:8-oxo-dGTP pyrophosphatase MutT (NUDIX family)
MEAGQLRYFPIDGTHLSFGDAVAAIIVLEDGRYVLQRRDDCEGIWYPGHWGCFGGAIDEGESAEQALRRELREELSFTVREAQPFASFNFDLKGMCHDSYQRIYYTLEMSVAEYNDSTLGEGSAIGIFNATEMLGELRLTPYDAFALFLHSNQARFEASSPIGCRR